MAGSTKVGLLGLGTVGTGLVELVTRNSNLIESKSGVSLEISRALVRDLSRPRALPKELITNDPDRILEDPDIDIVVEVMGGIEPAKSYILRALESGKNVVTANKAVLAAHGLEIFEVAARHGRQIGFEASVCGGIPIIRAITGGLVGNRVEELVGVLNGTTNYILTRMHDEGIPFAAALAEAQAKGLAEADPTFDVKGIDAAHKLLILAEILFQSRAELEDMVIEGIDSLELLDVEAAKEFGFRVKLLALATRNNGSIDLRVHPSLVPNDHPLASVSNEFNAVFLRGDATGELIFYGKGAGSMPTASAVLSDIVEISRNPDSRLIWDPGKSVPFAPVEGASRYYLRFPIFDRPGLIGRIATILGDHSISITHALADLVCNETNRGNVKIITHRANASAVRQALKEIEASGVLSSPPVALRIFH